MVRSVYVYGSPWESPSRLRMEDVLSFMKQLPGKLDAWAQTRGDRAGSPVALMSNGASIASVKRRLHAEVTRMRSSVRDPGQGSDLKLSLHFYDGAERCFSAPLFLPFIFMV